MGKGSPGSSYKASYFFFNLEYLFPTMLLWTFFKFQMKNLYCNNTLLIFWDNSSYGSRILMEYFFPMPSGMNLPWMLLTLEHHREGSNNGLSSEKTFRYIQSYVNKLILLRKCRLCLIFFKYSWSKTYVKWNFGTF